MRHTPPMRTSVSLYHRHRFPAKIISHSVWLYFRFALSFRDVEEMLAIRGVALTYETVREWCHNSLRLMRTAWLSSRYSRVISLFSLKSAGPNAGWRKRMHKF